MTGPQSSTIRRLPSAAFDVGEDVPKLPLGVRPGDGAQRLEPPDAGALNRSAR
ncbi:MAG: hypothetical protein M3071_04720 [Actinomycetota bacterium]|nr:hypothetical protein [Actinomycetota bacterium]